MPKATVDEVQARVRDSRTHIAHAHPLRALGDPQEGGRAPARAATEEPSDLITRESGLCKKDSLYEVGRVCDVLVFARIEALKDDGQVFSCDLTPHGKQRARVTRGASRCWA